MTIAVLGAGAFGTALALTLALKCPVTLWGRDADVMADMQVKRKTGPRIPGYALPDQLTATSDIGDVQAAEVVLLCLPMQQLGAFLATHPRLSGHRVACCKGLDLKTARGPTAFLDPDRAAILTGPSFAVDMARGLPTALTLACRDAQLGKMLQDRLSTPSLRLYRSSDVIGAELGGALKNVIAIGCGVVMGAGLGVSARAALMTRGFAEMQRIAVQLGARPETLQGLSGFGDLALTCTSDQSRNYRFGFALGANQPFDTTTTVEGRATAEALLNLTGPVDLPICSAIADLAAGRQDVQASVAALMRRPLKEE